MNDLVADIDGRPVFLERALDNLDGAHYACAETARLRHKAHHDGRAEALLARTRRATVPSPSTSTLVVKMALASGQALAYTAGERPRSLNRATGERVTGSGREIGRVMILTFSHIGWRRHSPNQRNLRFRRPIVAPVELDAPLWGYRI